MVRKTIDDVRKFWNANPLLTGELSEQAGTKKWFEAFDEIKTSDIFLDDLSDWVYPALEGKTILDVGTGPGYWNRRLGKMNLTYYGIDISSKSVEMAKKSQAIFGLHGSLQEGNAEELPFEDGFFDHVLSEGVLHHTPETQKCIDEVHRVLKDGGTACVSLYYKNIFLRSPAAFKTVLSLMRIFHIGLKGRGREKMSFASSPEELIRMYDGAENPIGKAYTKAEMKKMFSKFREMELSLYYIPLRAFPVKMPRALIKALSKRFGLMILAKVRK